MPRIKEVITRDDAPLITRIRLATKKTGGIYIHRLDAPDVFPPHDHPWTFRSFVVRGGYREAIYYDPLAGEGEPPLRISKTAKMRYANRKRWSLHKMTMDEAHLIFEIKPHTWTIVFRGPRRRAWGFWEWMSFRPAKGEEMEMQ